MQGVSRSSMGDVVTAPEGEDVHGLPSPSSGVGADAQSVPVLNSTARDSTTRHSGKQHSTAQTVGGCNNTDGTVPLTSDVSGESEPTCKSSLVPAVGTNGIAVLTSRLLPVRAQGMP